MRENKNSTAQTGFTTVELLVTILVATSFIVGFYQLYALSQKLSGSARQNSVASAVAFSNLRKFHSIDYPTWFVCNSSSEVTAENPTPPGQILLTETRTDLDLPAPVTAEVLAFAPYGCGESKPVKVMSVLRYGPSAKEVMHATFIGH